MSKDEKAQRPGVVLGPDGKPCRVCTDFRAWRPFKMGDSYSPASPAKKPLASSGVTSSAQTNPHPPPPFVPARPETCPPDGEQLGRATWTFLHTTAAYYPERPNPLQMRHMRALLSALPTLYPCSHCAAHLGECMKSHPPDVSGRAGLSRWLCDRHNDVNVMLGKEVFDCDKTDERWKDGPPDGSCD